MNHNDAQALIAWSVNDTLADDERVGVSEHAIGCKTCRDDLASTSLLAEVCRDIDDAEPAFDPAIIDRAVAQLDGVPQLPAQRADAPIEPVAEADSSNVLPFSERLKRRVAWSATPMFARVAIAAQVVLVVGLAAVVGLRVDDAPTTDAVYDTVAGPAAIAADATVVWTPEADSGDVADLLRAIDAEIVGGPNTLGMYRLRFAGDASASDRLAALKASELVLYAELAVQ